MIPSGHLSRIIDEVVEQIPMEHLTVYYAGGGSSSYQPKMMIKVWLYGYCERVYTGRRPAKAHRENIVFIWPAGSQTPFFKTLSEFRGERMQGIIDIVFKQLLLLLIDEGYIQLEDLYVDGSKWEANANRHKITWAKNTARYKAAVMDRIEALLREAQDIQAAEDKQYGSRDLPEVGEDKEVIVVLNSAQVSSYLVEMHRLIEEKTEQNALKKIEKKLLEEQRKLEKYEQQERLFNGRNSYSQTEERRQGLPVSQNQNLDADAGYGSEENYAALEKRDINACVKYPAFDQEQSGELLKKRFRRENFPYDP